MSAVRQEIGGRQRACTGLPVRVDLRFYPGEEERYVQEMFREEDFTPLTVERVIELDRIFGFGNPAFHKAIYGDRKILQIVEDGFLIAERTYHEAVWGSVAKSIAGRIGRELHDLGCGGVKPTVLELNTGSGSLTYSLCDHFNVAASVERNEQIYDWTQVIWQRYGGKDVEFVLMNAWEFVDQVIAEGGSFDVVFADPPFRGIHRRPVDPFCFSDYRPHGQKIVGHLLEIARFVSLKAPSSLVDADAEELAANLDAGLIIFEPHLITAGRRVIEKWLLFVRPDVRGDLIKYKYSWEVD